MKIQYLAFALSSAFVSTVHAQTPLTIYGTPPAATEPEDSRFRQASPAASPTSISIYGTIDGGVRYLTHVNTGGDSVLKMGSNGEYYNNRIGIQGTEDLGGGLNAHFHLESGFNAGTGALDNDDGRLFNRISSVGITGPFGSVDLGRQPSVACKAVYSYEPFQYRYVHIIPLAGAVAGNLDGSISRPFGTVDGPRFSNAIQYFGKVGSFIASAEYAMGEVPGNDSDASAQAVGLVYKGSPFTFGGAYTRQKPNIAAAGAADYQQQNQLTFGGAYKAGALRIAGGYMRTDTDTAVAAVTQQTNNTWIGASYDFTPLVSITAGYYRTTLERNGNETARRNLAILGATYALSRRTNLYADIDHAGLSGIATLAAGGQTSQLGISVGINHAF
jgi:predicted porin